MIVAHSHIVDEDTDGQTFNVVGDPCDVALGARAEVDVNDLGPDAFVLGLNVGGNILKLERSATDLKINLKLSKHLNTC